MESESLNRRFYGEKLERAVKLLMYRRGRMPGAKEWELKAHIGADYEKVIKQLNEILTDIGLEVKRIVTEDTSRTAGVEENARYIVVSKEKGTAEEAKMLGWRIDNLAGLAITVAYLISKQGKASRKEIEDLLSHKFGKWKAVNLIEAYIRNAYIVEGESELLSIGWRTKAEVDLKNLMKIMTKA